MDRQITKFRDVITTIMERSPREWVYLPKAGSWSLEAVSATLESEEVPSELEEEPDAGIPALALHHGLMQVLPVTTLQDIIFNARVRKPTASPEDLFRAFKFYYDRDAFIEF
jgi:hypothetical protein